MRLSILLFIILLCPVLTYAEVSTDAGAPMTYQYGKYYYALVPDTGATYTGVHAGAKYLINLNQNVSKQILVDNITTDYVQITVQDKQVSLMQGQTKYFDSNKNNIVDLEVTLVSLDNDTISLILKNWELESGPVSEFSYLQPIIEQNKLVLLILIMLVLLYLFTNRGKRRNVQ